MSRPLEAQPYAGALEAVDRIVNREPEPDEVLRQTVRVLADRIAGYRYVGISFTEEGRLLRGPSAGERAGDEHELEVPIVFEEQPIGALTVACAGAPSAADRLFLQRVALLVSAHTLVGWDTGGVAWPDVE